MTEKPGLGNEKAAKLAAYFHEAGIDCFDCRDSGDELQTVLFRTQLTVEEQHLPLLVVTDSSLYTLIKVRVAANAVNDGNRQAVLEYLNELNRQYKAFKYSGSAENDIVLEICLPATPAAFDPQLVQILIDLALRHLREVVPVLSGKIGAA
ncbi:MAG: YbjN domain-containing protein [Sporomusaceae bacterium]|nr:YbjN domain-containing protein [Sporomusaceae bacterium]